MNILNIHKEHLDPKEYELLFKVVDRLLIIVVSCTAYFLDFIGNWDFIPGTRLKDPGQYYYSE